MSTQESKTYSRKSNHKRSSSREHSSSVKKIRHDRKGYRSSSSTNESRSRDRYYGESKRSSHHHKKDRERSRSNDRDRNIHKRIHKKSQEDLIKTLENEIKLLLPENYPRKGYQSTKNKKENEDINHWGQRKLFLSELWFLTKYGNLAKTIVYAGAAPSHHTPYLMTLFPEHRFILIDPSEFKLKKLDPEPVNFKERIELINDYFTDELARTLATKYPGDILFISDIRTADKDKLTPDEIENYVRNDNIKQMDWINIMKPKKSMLKFRCPYPSIEAGKKNLKMFKGEIYLQPWAPPKSSETRLVPDDSMEIIEYDNVKYEEQLYYHNMEVRRKSTFSQPIRTGEGFDQRWDISAEILIIKQFFDKFPDFCGSQPDYKDLNLFQKIVKFSETLSRNISIGGRNLAHKMNHKIAYQSKIDHERFYKSEKVGTTFNHVDFDNDDN